jgi:hypothetical protein
MTKEQIIVFGFVVAAFGAGWIVSFITRRRAAADDGLPLPPPPRHTLEPITTSARAASPPLTDEVGEALQSDAANEGMLSVVRAEGDGLTELELDLADWGFTYGVAWARARERAPSGADDAVAAEALDAAQQVFKAYTAGDDWTQRAEPRNGDGPDGDR